MKVKTMTTRPGMSRHFVRTPALVLALAAFGIPCAQAQGMMRGGMMGETSALPQNVPKALSRYGCMVCHAVHSGKAGPAFDWVAWKYRAKSGALSRISAFVEHGGTSTWGGVMPDQNVPPAQARRIARWILSLPPEAP